MPLSTTHVISSSIMGVALTLPVTAGLGYVLTRVAIL
jgi:phosphate/sulfate permease